MKIENVNSDEMLISLKKSDIGDENKLFGDLLYALQIYGVKEFNNNFVIHTGAYFSTKYIIEKNNDIHANFFAFFNVKYDSKILLEESVNFGKKLYNLFSDGFYADFLQEKFYDVTIINSEVLESTSIETNLKDVQNLFIDWFSRVGFISDKPLDTLHCKEVNFPLKSLREYRNKYIILYQMYTVIYSINCLLDFFKECMKCEFLLKKDTIIKTAEKNLNRFLKSINHEEFKITQFFKECTETLLDLKLLFLYKLQHFSDYFRIQITPYIVAFNYKSNNSKDFSKIKSKSISTSENIFDLAWNILINYAIYEDTDFSNFKQCKCGKFFIYSHGNNTLCDSCKENEQKERSKKEREERKELINEICSFKNSLIIKDSIAIQYLNTVIDLTVYGNSAKRASFSLKTLKEYKEYILNHSKQKKVTRK